MASLNLCQFIGNIGRIETRYLSNGDAVTNFSIACNESFKNKNGEKVEKTVWISCVAYRKLAEIMSEYCPKGMQIYVSGRLETRKFTDKNGIERYTTEIIASDMKMLGSKQSGSESKPLKQQAKPAGNGFEDFEDDLIPF